MRAKITAFILLFLALNWTTSKAKSGQSFSKVFTELEDSAEYPKHKIGVNLFNAITPYQIFSNGFKRVHVKPQYAGGLFYRHNRGNFSYRISYDRAVNSFYHFNDSITNMAPYTYWELQLDRYENRFKFGVQKDYHLNRLHPYVAADLILGLAKSEGFWRHDNSLNQLVTEDISHHDFIYGFGLLVGFDFEINSQWGLLAEMQIWWDEEYQFNAAQGASSWGRSGNFFYSPASTLGFYLNIGALKQKSL